MPANRAAHPACPLCGQRHYLPHMSLRSACILLGLLLLGANVLPGSVGSHRGTDAAAAVASHVAADIAQSNAPHEDAAGGPPRADSLMRAPRHEALLAGAKALSQPEACWIAHAHRRCALPAGTTYTRTTPSGDTGREPGGDVSTRAPPAG